MNPPENSPRIKDHIARGAYLRPEVQAALDRLSPEQREEMTRLHTSGAPTPDIAVAFSTTGAVVDAVVRKLEGGGVL